MPEWIIALLLLIVLAVVYFILPQEIYVEKRAQIKVNASSAYRNIADQNNWAIWWPEQNASIKSKAPLIFDQYRYSLQQSFFQSLVIQVDAKDRQISSTLTFIPLGIDYTIFEWKALVQGGPWQKVQTYFYAKRVQSQMEDILESLKEYMENEENIYGFKVRLSKQQDTALVTTKFTTTTYPGTNEIYQYISLLKTYVASQGATETNYPMLHVQKVDSNLYESMVAVPTNRNLQGRGDIVFKRMLHGGSILEAEVRGGPATAQQALVQLGNYKDDHQLVSPAIPFMLLVTDRSKERDTAKWVTRIYYPVY